MSAKKFTLKFLYLVLITALVFIALKMTRVIAWDWIWVISPLWIEGAFFSLLLAVSTICGGVMTNTNDFAD